MNTFLHSTNLMKSKPPKTGHIIALKLLINPVVKLITSGKPFCPSDYKKLPLEISGDLILAYKYTIFGRKPMLL